MRLIFARAACLLFLGGLLFARPSGAVAQEIINFPTVHYQIISALVAGQGTPQTARGTLRLPASGTGSVPVVVVSHSINGWSDSNEGWAARELNKAGYATFELDSYGPRDVRDAAQTSGSWINPTLTSDAFHGLAALARHPRIDVRRSAVIGFSAGGEVAHLASMSVVADRLAPKGPRFAAHAAFYPICGIAANPAKSGYTGAPVLMLLGEKDDAGPPAKCLGLLDHYRKSGRPVPVRVITYPGAPHAWTNSGIGSLRFYAQFPSPGRCPTLLFDPSAYLENGATRAFNPQELGACLQRHRGYSMGFDPDIRDRSMADLVAFLKTPLGG